MMTWNQIKEREQLEMLTIKQLVPHDHLVRKLGAALDQPPIDDSTSYLARLLGCS
ncbi:hypothetical protein M3152_13735 [Sporosarcina luteola]|uniref:hypothetical protein n=1 Tax=Bacillales TaxID=1385 RepID=UPI00203D0FDE|nr:MULTISPECIES: hypothetical protein [Bacillales]MCM3638760.1 hypothetical protein [Sporosarcina luteola]